MANIRALARGIAAQLTEVTGGAWTADEQWSVGNDSEVLHGPDGARLWLMQDWDVQGKLAIHGKYPKTDQTTAHSHSINAAPERGAEAIARDINRRLLPDYLTELARVTGIKQRADADRRDREAVITGLVPAGSTDTTFTDYEAMVRLHRSDGLALAYGDVKATGDGTTVNIDLTGVPAEKAAQILALLAPEAPAKPKPVDQALFNSTAPQWNCVDYPGEGMHYRDTLGACQWCGMTRVQIAAEHEARQQAMATEAVRQVRGHDGPCGDCGCPAN